MELEKAKRIVNKSLLKEYQKKSCEICGTFGNVSAHHVKSKGSGGHDYPTNLMPLCFMHHTEIHQLGLNKMIWKYPHLKNTLTDMGWEKADNKWILI